jgi:hypothetical protein
MHPKIIGFSGFAGSGKSTAARKIADRLNTRLPENEPRADLTAFARPLKLAAKELYGFSDHALYGPSDERSNIDNACLVHPVHGPVTPRFVLTEIGAACRMIHPDTFVECARTYTAARASSSCVFLFQDVRYNNEAAWIRQQGGLIFHIDYKRSWLERLSRHLTFSHESEQGIDKRYITHHFTRPRDPSFVVEQHMYEQTLFVAVEQFLNLAPGFLTEELPSR